MSKVSEIINEFLDRILQPREASYVGATTPAARQYVSLFKFIGNQLLDYQSGWTQLKKIYTFTTSTGVANYQLPGDFLRPLIGTAWGVTNQIPLSGPLSNARLAFQTYGVNIATPFPGFQLNGAQGYIFNTSPYTQKSAGYFQISPAGQDNTTQSAIAYISSNYAWPTDWIASTVGYIVGSKVTGVNNVYIATAITTGISGTTRPSVLTGSVVDGGVTWTVYNEPYPITADTDFILLDDDLFIEGLRWAWYTAKQQFTAAATYRKDWEKSVKAALGRQNGAAIISAAYDVNSSPDWPVVPPGGWSNLPG